MKNKINKIILTSALVLSLIFSTTSCQSAFRVINQYKDRLTNVSPTINEAENDDTPVENTLALGETEYKNLNYLESQLPTDATLLQKAAAKAVPSVVLVQSYGDQEQILSPEDFFRRFNEGYQEKDEDNSDPYAKSKLIGEGSGIVISDEGFIVTNAHVVKGAKNYKVVNSEGESIKAEIVGLDEISDLAVLKVTEKSEKPLLVATIGKSDKLTVAEQVIAIGNPGGSELSSTVTIGYVSALNRVINHVDGSQMTYIQTDAAINPGNSGGALVNLQGEVIGINTAKIQGTQFEGLGFAIPIDTALPIIEDLIENGEVKGRALLGISGAYVKSDFIDSEGNKVSGFIIASIQNEDLVKNGVKSNMIITEIEDIKITSLHSIRNVLANKRDGDEVKLKIFNPIGQEYLNTTIIVKSEY